MLPKLLTVSVLLAVISVNPLAAEEKLSALIVDGQNNHGVWPKTSKMMTKYLEDTGLFQVEIARTAAEGTDPNFQPDFSKYALVVSNYNGAAWPEATQSAFVDYVSGGGGFVVVHAANNAFGDWQEYNEMIGVGGWGGRNEKTGPYIFVDDSGRVVRDGKEGAGGHHGPEHPFTIIVRDDTHPITRGMPPAWLHTQDELYDLLRGPGDNMHILATAFADPEKGGSGRHEPMIMTIEYGKGRVFHTPMGHGDYSQECVGFIATFQRGAEWAATGQVTQALPDDFPTPDNISQRKFEE
jgi:type 1 glutamine amidotransferase